ncbi:hypothetical protein GCM10020258_01540 [Sphingomonas yabuuchiae]
MSAAMVLIMMVQAAPPDLSLPRITPRADCSMSRDEVVVCGRRGASDRYRIPPSVRSMDTEADGAGNGLSGTQVLGELGLAACLPIRGAVRIARRVKPVMAVDATL